MVNIVIVDDASRNLVNISKGVITADESLTVHTVNPNDLMYGNIVLTEICQKIRELLGEDGILFLDEDLSRREFRGVDIASRLTDHFIVAISTLSKYKAGAYFTDKDDLPKEGAQKYLEEVLQFALSNRKVK